MSKAPAAADMASSATPPRWQGMLFLCLKIGLSTGLTVYLVARIGVAETMEIARELSPSALGIGLGLMLSYVAVAALRWLVVLRALGCPARSAGILRITFVGLFFNQILPGTVGADAIRIWEATRGGVGLGLAVNSVLLERVVHVLTLVLLGSTGVMLLGASDLLGGATSAMWLLILAAATVGAGLVLVERSAARWIPKAASRAVSALSEGALRIARQPRSLLMAVTSVVVGQALLSIIVLTLAHSLDIPIDPIVCFSLLPTIMLVASLPVSVAGWGVREYAMVAGFGYFGVPSSGALALSLLIGLIGMVAALPGGLLWLIHRGNPRRNQLASED